MLFPCDFPQHAHSVVYVRIRVHKQTQILAFFHHYQNNCKIDDVNNRKTRRQRNFTGHLRRVRIVYIDCKRNKTKFFHW